VKPFSVYLFAFLFSFAMFIQLNIFSTFGLHVLHIVACTAVAMQ
jgi:hypothetical protein